MIGTNLSKQRLVGDKHMWHMFTSFTSAYVPNVYNCSTWLVARMKTIWAGLDSMTNKMNSHIECPKSVLYVSWKLCEHQHLFASMWRRKPGPCMNKLNYFCQHMHSRISDIQNLTGCWCPSGLLKDVLQDFLLLFRLLLCSTSNFITASLTQELGHESHGSNPPIHHPRHHHHPPGPPIWQPLTALREWDNNNKAPTSLVLWEISTNNKKCYNKV